MKKIALDAGHGLKTHGKQTPNGIKEWTLNDSVRGKVIDILKDYEVLIINTDNDEGAVDESLANRLATYKKADVDVFVSIHHNAYTGNWGNATGVEVYTDNNPTNADLRLADCIYGRLVNYTGLRGRGIKRLNFYVINQNTIPAVLVEGGFMDGTEDYKVITSDAGQTAYAKAVAEGLIEFLDLKKRVLNKDVDPAENTTTESVLYRVQVGSYRYLAYAEAMYKKVKAAGFDAYITNVEGLYKVQVGAFSKKANADSMVRKLENSGFQAFITLKGGSAVNVKVLKTIDEVAEEVIRGEWGNGEERKALLEREGYDYDAVQKRVNDLI